jgi:hypothetical protein
MSLEPQEALPSDVEQIVSFHNAAYGNSRKPEHWMWEYKGNYPDLFVFTVIKDQDQIVATQGMIPIYLSIQGKRLFSGKSDSTLLNPQYRGGSLFQELYEIAVALCRDRKMSCIWGYTAAVKAFEKFQFRTYEYVMWSSISILNLRRALSELGQKDSGAARRVIEALKVLGFWLYSSLLRATYRSSGQGLAIGKELAHPQDLEHLYQRLREKHSPLIHIDLDEQYLRWRVYGHPIFKYKTYFVYEDDCLTAYAIVNSHDKRMAYLVDFTFESVNAARFLLQQILRELQTQDFRAVTFWANRTNPVAQQTFLLLRRFGFLERKTTMHFVLRNLAVDDEENLFEVANWYMNGLWTEGYRI